LSSNYFVKNFVVKIVSIVNYFAISKIFYARVTHYPHITLLGWVVGRVSCCL